MYLYVLFLKNDFNIFSYYLSFLIFTKVFQCIGFWFLFVGLLLTFNYSFTYAFNKYVANTYIPAATVDTENIALKK